MPFLIYFDHKINVMINYGRIIGLTVILGSRCLCTLVYGCSTGKHFDPYFFVRLGLAVPFHLKTIILLYWGVRKGVVWGMTALVLAIGLHYLFNMFVAGVMVR